MAMLTNKRHESRIGIKGSAVAILGFAIFSTLAGALLFSPRTWAQQAQLDAVRLPDGFAIDYYAANVPGARSMTLSP